MVGAWCEVSAPRTHTRLAEADATCLESPPSHVPPRVATVNERATAVQRPVNDTRAASRGTRNPPGGVAVFELILLLLSAIGDVEVREQSWDELWIGGREYSGVVTCEEGEPAVWWSNRRLTPEVIAHELAHIYDCIDDGELNGSTGHPRVFRRGVVYASHCLSNSREWYACEVVRTGTLR